MSRRRVFLRRRRARGRLGALMRMRKALEIAAQVTAPHFAVPTDLVLRPAAGRRPPVAETQARRITLYLAHTSGQVSMRALSEITGQPYRGKRGIGDVVRQVEERRDDPDFDALVARFESLFDVEFGAGAAG